LEPAADASAVCGRHRLKRSDLQGRNKRLETPFNLRLTCPQLLLNTLILFEVLLQRKEMIGPPVPFQGLGDRGLIVFATLISVASQALGIALACKNGTENFHPCLSVNIADHLSQFAVHLLQGFLHMLYGLRGHGNQHTALPQGAAQDTDLVPGTKGALEEAIGVELLQPLTVLNACLAPWHLTWLMGINQLDVKPTRFEPFEKGNPVDAGRLHHDGLNLTPPQPLGQGVEVSRKRPKALQRLRIAITGHGHKMGVGPHINPGGIAMLLLSRR
jgi:hypothetical protein